MTEWTDAFRGRRVLLTGHTGFKGGWLGLWLGELGAEVTGYALGPATTPNLCTMPPRSGATQDEKLAGSTIKAWLPLESDA